MQPVTEELIQEIKERIVNAFQPEKIILFGSYAYGNPTKDSDIFADFALSAVRKSAFICVHLRLNKLIFRQLLPQISGEGLV